MQVGVISDFGVNKGGGDFVILNILEALSERYDVTLITSTLSGFYEASNFFNKEISGLNIFKVKMMPLLHHPYTIAHMARKVAKEDDYDLFILADDVPKCLSDRKVISYVHFPHVTRIKFMEHIMRKYTKTITGRVKWWVHKNLFRKFYPMQQISSKWLLVVNSKLTMKSVAESLTLDPKSTTLLNPPVASSNINTLWRNSHVKKEDLIVCIGWFEPVKGVSDVVHAFSLIKDEPRCRLRLIGFKGDESYLRELEKIIAVSGTKDRVELFLNAKRDTLIDSLLRAKVIVHPALREHFGIAVVEGMAAGCIPIVRRGFNGPWMEIVQESKYGLGFETVEELSSAIRKAIKTYDNFDINKITLRALEFDEKIFKTKFLEIVDQFLGR
jgi:glycosyltransferase involved in cell wall biosynthesis